MEHRIKMLMAELAKHSSSFAKLTGDIDINEEDEFGNDFAFYAIRFAPNSEILLQIFNFLDEKSYNFSKKNHQGKTIFAEFLQKLAHSQITESTLIGFQLVNLMYKSGASNSDLQEDATTASSGSLHWKQKLLIRNLKATCDIDVIIEQNSSDRSVF